MTPRTPSPSCPPRSSRTIFDEGKTERVAKTRNVGLDLLRFVAVFLVLGRHLDAVPANSVFLTVWRRGGWVGVDLFFVLSGYLVSGLLFDEYRRVGSVDIGRFLIRRGWKIYPAFWVFIAGTLLYRFLVEPAQPFLRTGRAAVAELLFVQNYVAGLWPHTWTLAVEEHFYIGLALLTSFLLARPSPDPFRGIPVIFTILALTCLGLRLWTGQLADSSEADWYRFAGTHLRIDSLFFGVLLAYGVRFRGWGDRLARIPTIIFVAAGIALLLPAFIWEIDHTTWLRTVGATAFYFAGGLLVVAATRLQHTRSRLLHILATLGAASYSIYLWHNAVNWWVALPATRALGEFRFPAYVAVYVCSACFFGWALSSLIEIPLLGVRDRWFPSRRLADERPLEQPS